MSQPPSSRGARPAFLLRICSQRVESLRLLYELHDLRDGIVHRFASLAALSRFLRQQSPDDQAAAKKR